jgi:Rrf2 family protein
MFRFSKKTDYALLALQYLASPGESGDVSARAIAERFEIPAELLAKFLQRLASYGLTTAHKGVHGGYRRVTGAAKAPPGGVLPGGT